MDKNIQDSASQLEAKAVGLNGLGDFSMKDFAIFKSINEQMSKNLGDSLPVVALYSKDGDANNAETSKEKRRETRKAPPGEEIKSEDLKKSHINATRTVEDGKKVTNAEYPNGVGIKVKEGSIGEGESRFQATEAKIEHNGDLTKKGNSFVDKTGKEIIKRNVDGSYTIDTGEGFFRQSPSGIQKVHAIRERDGSFREINVKDPLGDLKMSDPAAKKK